MGVAVRLDEILQAMEMPPEWESFIDPETGEIVTISEDDRIVLDREEDGEAVDVPAWQGGIDRQDSKSPGLRSSIGPTRLLRRPRVGLDAQVRQFGGRC
jgi:hypothetical protein